MVLAAGKRGLVAGGAASHVEALDEPQLGEQLERPIYGGDADRLARCPELVRHLTRAEHAVLGADQLEDRGAWCARPVAGLPQRGFGSLHPGAGGRRGDRGGVSRGRVHSAENDSRSHLGHGRSDGRRG